MAFCCHWSFCLFVKLVLCTPRLPCFNHRKISSLNANDAVCKVHSFCLSYSAAVTFIYITVFIYIHMHTYAKCVQNVQVALQKCLWCRCMHILWNDYHRISTTLFGRDLSWSPSPLFCSKPGECILNHLQINNSTERRAETIG